MLKLTQCMIVKNEENNIMRALTWGKDLFDEQIVIDTGSSDRTAAIAAELGATVISFSWIDDFSAARNFGISHCTGDWIFFLDADEYFKAEDVALLKSIMEKVDKMTVTDKGRKLLYNVVETPWINGEDDSHSRQARIFRNVPYLRYAGALHEQIHAMPGGYRKVYSVKETPAIYHTGYLWSENDSKAAKGKRNYEVAKKALEKSGESAKLKLFAAGALMEQEKYKEAEEYFFEAMENSDGSIWPERMREGYKQWLTAYMQRKDFDTQAQELQRKALFVYDKAVTMFPDDPDFDILLSLICFKARDIKNMILFFRASQKKEGGRITEGLTQSKAYQKLKAVFEQLGQLYE